MKYRVVDLLAPVPKDGSLRVGCVREEIVVPFTEAVREVKCQRFCALRNLPVKTAGVTPSDCADCFSREIVEGDLVTDDGRHFVIKGGIPRMISSETADFVRRNRESFSLEWKYYRYGERNWGMDIESRKTLFVNALGQPPEAIKNKLILDAGCGSGLLSIEMAETFGLEVVALDLADGIEKAYATNTAPFVYFIQGSVLEPPFRAGIFDYIYCAGVLIHLPSTHQGFERLAPLLSVGGRQFVWVYHPLEYHKRTGDYLQERRNEWVRSRVTSRLPIRMQEAIYFLLLAPYFIKRALLNPFRSRKEDRTWREKMQNFIDSLSPVNAHRHTEDEVAEWFRAAGFSNITKSYSDRYGFGMRGDRVE